MKKTFIFLLSVSSVTAFISMAQANYEPAERMIDTNAHSESSINPEETEVIKWFNKLTPREQVSALNDAVALDVGMLRLMKAFAEFNRQVIMEKQPVASRDRVAKTFNEKIVPVQNKEFDL